MYSYDIWLFRKYLKMFMQENTLDSYIQESICDVTVKMQDCGFLFKIGRKCGAEKQKMCNPVF